MADQPSCETAGSSAPDSSAPDPVIEPASLDHINRVLELNEAAVPAVNSVPFSQMVWYLDQANHETGMFLVAKAEKKPGDQEIAGFFVGLLPNTGYHSLHYRWFGERWNDFAYIDRVVVDPSFHRRGIAAGFYRSFEDWARGRAQQMVCDVNRRPPNPESMAYHQKLGFAEVGRQETADGAKEVYLLSRPIS